MHEDDAGGEKLSQVPVVLGTRRHYPKGQSKKEILRGGMWKVIPTGGLWGCLIALAMALALVISVFRYGGADSFSLLQFVGVAIFSTGPIFTLAFWLGNSPMIWGWTCKLSRKWYPSFAEHYDISGDWTGTTRSTFPLGVPVAGTGLYEADMSMAIEQSWLKLKVTTTRPGSPTVGTSVVSEVLLNDKRATYYTVFRGENQAPESAGNAEWFGASQFKYSPENRTISGRYASNRGFLDARSDDDEVSQSTAGDFTLTRAAKAGADEPAPLEATDEKTP